MTIINKGKAAMLVLGMLPVVAGASVLSPFKAVYEVSRGSMSLGHATFAMTAEGDNCFRYQDVARPEGIAAVLTGKTSEETRFCMVGGKIRVQSYKITRDGGDKNDNYNLNFDWDRNLVSTNNGEGRKLPDGAVDSLSLHIALRQLLQDAGRNLPTDAMTINVVDEDEVKVYTFAVTGHEKIKTAIGSLDTVRVERTNTKRKQIRFWLAPSLSYLPVRVETQKRDDTPISLDIESLPQSPAG